MAPWGEKKIGPSWPPKLQNVAPKILQKLVTLSEFAVIRVRQRVWNLLPTPYSAVIDGGVEGEFEALVKDNSILETSVVCTLQSIYLFRVTLKFYKIRYGHTYLCATYANSVTREREFSFCVMVINITVDNTESIKLKHDAKLRKEDLSKKRVRRTMTKLILFNSQ